MFLPGLLVWFEEPHLAGFREGGGEAWQAEAEVGGGVFFLSRRVRVPPVGLGDGAVETEPLLTWRLAAGHPTERTAHATVL